MKTDAERIKWLLDRSHAISHIVAGIEDEGDRAYFGSTLTSRSHLLSRRVRSADEPYLAKS